jgi:Tfp pilus assembly protein PilF
LCLASVAPLLLDATSARAQPAPSASAVERADAAFDEGRELFDQGRFKEACEKFDLSMQLDPSPGTLLNLGNCHEPQGELAQALALFERALSDALKSTDAKRRELWTKAARERIAALQGRLPHLVVRGLPEGGALTLDGEPIEASAPTRRNPGKYLLAVTAPGKRRFERSLELAAGQRLELELPALEAEAAPAPTLTPPPLEQERAPAHASSFGPWPFILAGTGAALVVTSLLTGSMARKKADELKSECRAGSCDPSMEDVKDSAETLALTTDVLWIGGALLAGVGVTLFVIDTTSATNETATLIQTGCFETGCGLVANGRF